MSERHLMFASVCNQDTKTFIAYLDAINMNITASMNVLSLVCPLPDGLVFALFIAHYKE